MSKASASTFAIRDETPADWQAIHELTKEAFKPMPYASGAEQRIIRALREEGALALSLVADCGGAVVGHVAFSPLETNGAKDVWYALGPVAVRPSFQKQGIGSALIEAGLARLRSWGAVGCALVGDPGYYSRFGFRRDERMELVGAPPEYAMTLRLRQTGFEGAGRFHEAFFRSFPNEP